MHNRLASLLADMKTGVAFTGAGISTESGIADYRSPGGVWARTQPVMFDDFVNRSDARHEYWNQKAAIHPEIVAAAPNIAHRTLAWLEQQALLAGIITQNIDGLHQLAGSQTVVELHGTAREISCLTCAARFDADAMVRTFLETDAVPDCPECGGLLKHATISFGQQLDSAVIESATDLCARCDVFIVFGSSLVVHPAAGLPMLAQQHGAKLVIINRDETPLDNYADLVVNAPIGDVLHEINGILGWTP